MLPAQKVVGEVKGSEHVERTTDNADECECVPLDDHNTDRLAVFGMRNGRGHAHRSISLSNGKGVPHMRRVFAVLGSAFFLVLAPGTVAGLVPWWISGWRLESPASWWLPLRVIGGVLAVAGMLILIDSFARFAIQGLGTPAPVFPTRHLVITGLYRYVRNPMYVAVASLIVGQGLIFGNARVLEYGALVWLSFHIFVVVYEEPTLRASFGAEYESFCRSVPRWIPRLTPAM